MRNLLTSHANVLGFWVNNTNMINTTYLLAKFILNEVVSCKVYKIQKTKKKTISLLIKNLCEKNVKNSFGALQLRWSMITHPCRLWSISDKADVMYACIIMHNMIIEDKANANLHVLLAPSSSHNTLRRGFTFNDLQVITSNLQDLESYYSLRDDLVQHL